MTSRGSMRVFNVDPLHEKFDLPNARIVATGAPEQSVLLRRMSVFHHDFEERYREYVAPLCAGSDRGRSGVIVLGA